MPRGAHHVERRENIVRLNRRLGTALNQLVGAAQCGAEHIARQREDGTPLVGGVAGCQQRPALFAGLDHDRCQREPRNDPVGGGELAASGGAPGA